MYTPTQECFLLDAANFKLKERFSFEEIQQITVSSRADGLVVLRLPMDGPNARVRYGQLHVMRHNAFMHKDYRYNFV